VQVPLNYHKLLLRLQATHKQRLSFNDVVGIAKECNMPTAPELFSLDSEVCDALGTLHDLGELLWWGKNASLNDVVVLDPQWLITAFTTSIRDPRLHSIPWLDAELDRLVAAGAERQAQLDTDGIKTRTALDSARASATEEADIRGFDNSISVLDMMDAVQLLRKRSMLTEPLFAIIWPVTAAHSDDDSAASAGVPHYTKAEQEVHSPCPLYSRQAVMCA
jgi:hypothetical protein